MTTASSATSRRSFGRRRSIRATRDLLLQPFVPPYFRDGSPARRLQAIRRTADGWFGSRTWKRRSAQSMSALTARSGRPRRSASFAAARTATCRISNGGAWCIKISAARGRRRPRAPDRAGSRCGWKIPGPALIRGTRASFANAARPCRSKSCFSRGVWGHVLERGLGLVRTILIPIHATRAKG